MPSRALSCVLTVDLAYVVAQVRAWWGSMTPPQVGRAGRERVPGAAFQEPNQFGGAAGPAIGSAPHLR